MSDTVRGWVDLVHAHWPPAHASSWDNVGLQVGDPAWPVARVLVCLDVTPAVIGEAATVAHTLVLAHHPLLFRPLETLTPSTASGRTALLAASHRVAVLAVHTNLDVAGDGVGTSDPVAKVLDLRDRTALTSHLTESANVKVVTFVPVGYTEAVLDAMAGAGAGTIGDYDRCSFRVAGRGTFTPREGATPFSGQVGLPNADAEERLEMVVPRRRLAGVLTALRAAHPYEEVAIDTHPLLDQAEVGFGVVGDLPQPTVLRSVAEALRSRLPSPHLRLAGDPGRFVQRVAVVGGAGDSLITAAHAAGADVYVTGDLRHHVTLDALTQGMAVIDAGHHATEVAALAPWQARLADLAARAGLEAPLVASGVSTDPWVVDTETSVEDRTHA